MSAVASNNAVMGLPAQSVLALQGSATPISLIKGTSTEAELREKFTQFVGETFYGQMFKAMRSTVGKPAYFHGGRAEEVFQSQLDQTMAQELTKSTAATFAEPMFERQFPQFAERGSASNDFEQLAQLQRR
jgi:Rod binding domain-containing protein